jgi:hypothetical protein
MVGDDSDGGCFIGRGAFDQAINHDHPQAELAYEPQLEPGVKEYKHYHPATSGCRMVRSG